MAPKMLTSGTAGCARLDLIILMDEVQQVQLLALVLVQALGLDIEHGIGVNLHILGVQQPVSQGLFVVVLYGGQLFQHISSSAKVSSFSSSAASLRKPEPMCFSSSVAVSAGSHSSSQRRKVMPLVLLLNFSGYSS